MVSSEGESDDMSGDCSTLCAALEARFMLPAPIARPLAHLLERAATAQSEIVPLLDTLYDMTSHHDFWDQADGLLTLQRVVQEFFVEDVPLSPQGH